VTGAELATESSCSGPARRWPAVSLWFASRSGRAKDLLSSTPAGRSPPRCQRRRCLPTRPARAPP
jgi:hypothetical protein